METIRLHMKATVRNRNENFFQILISLYVWLKKRALSRVVNTVFDLITAHTPIAQSSNITASIFSFYFFTKAYVVGTHLNCIDLSMQFK